MWIEVFKAGEQTDSTGLKRSFSIEDLEQIANNYNKSIQEDNKSQAPLVKGHPSTEAPALGYVERLARRGDKLVANIENIEQSLIEEVKSGAYKNVSISLTPQLMLRHIGILGATLPAVEELAPIEFSSQSVSLYSEQEEAPSTKEDELSKLKAELDSLKKEKLNSQIMNFANSLSQDNQANKEAIINLLNYAVEADGTSESMDFESGKHFNSIFAYLKSFNLKNKSQLTNRLSSDFSGNSNGRNYDSQRMQLHNATQNLIMQNPNLHYERALELALS